MPLAPPIDVTLARRLFERYYPGVLKDLIDAGARFKGDRQRPLDVGDLSTFYGSFFFEDPEMLVRITSTFRRKPVVERIFFEFHCGPNPYNNKETHFRIDFNSAQGLHVHLPPNCKEHVGPGRVTPEITEALDVNQFVKWALEFRATRVVPLRRKT